jgi:hypothetical protein
MQTSVIHLRVGFFGSLIECVIVAVCRHHQKRKSMQITMWSELPTGALYNVVDNERAASQSCSSP